LKPALQARWLLIGNSRWHWAAPPRLAGEPLRVWHSPPWRGERSEPESPGAVDQDDPLLPGSSRLVGWAAVGVVPPEACLPSETRLQLAAVPLLEAPPWLGIDRALAGWWAWRLKRAPVLVADAGTVLSFTRLDRDGRFIGGRLLAGVALQLRAMAGGTAQLPAVGPDGLAMDPAERPLWPQDTAAAMGSGVLRGLAAAIRAATLEARREEPHCQLLLTGGDGAVLTSLLDPALEAELRPHLCLEALAALRPADGSGEPDQSRPRSLRI
jgi:type III pantothenate kinase